MKKIIAFCLAVSPLAAFSQMTLQNLDIGFTSSKTARKEYVYSKEKLKVYVIKAKESLAKEVNDNTDYVPLETALQKGFVKMNTIVAAFNQARKWPKDIVSFESKLLPALPDALDDEHLFAQQQIISHVLENAVDYEDAMHKFQYTSLRQSDWKIEQWDEAMLDTAIQIAQKWK